MLVTTVFFSTSLTFNRLKNDALESLKESKIKNERMKHPYSFIYRLSGIEINK